MRWMSCTMARHDSVAMGNALRRKSIEKCSFSRLKPRIFACGARAAGCAGESVFLHHARVNRPYKRRSTLTRGTRGLSLNPHLCKCSVSCTIPRCVPTNSSVSAVAFACRRV